MADPINDGGPAFPSPWEPLPEGYFHPDNPIGQTPPKEVFGMSLRDWFAGQALHKCLCMAHNDYQSGDIAASYNIVTLAAHNAYSVADAMLKARAAK